MSDKVNLGNPKDALYQLDDLMHSFFFSWPGDMASWNSKTGIDVDLFLLLLKCSGTKKQNWTSKSTFKKKSLRLLDFHDVKTILRSGRRTLQAEAP